MGNKKLGLAAIFSNKPKPKPKLSAADDGSASRPWPLWPSSCATSPQTTASFRWMADGDHRPCATTAAGRLLPPLKPAVAPGDMYRTVNSVYFDSADSSFSFIDNDDEDGDDDDCVSFSTTTASEEWSEAVIRNLRRSSSSTADRFFFDSSQPPASNSILACSRSPSPGRTPAVARSVDTKKDPAVAAAAAAVVMPPDDDPERDDYDGHSEEEDEEPNPLSPSALVGESVAVALDSKDPYGDFRASMEEMVAAHGLRNWAALQELLSWYLRINAAHNHALIVGAFIDLLLAGTATTSGPRSSAATTTTMTTTTSTPSSSSSSY